QDLTLEGEDALSRRSDLGENVDLDLAGQTFDRPVELPADEKKPTEDRQRSGDRGDRGEGHQLVPADVGECLPDQEPEAAQAHESPFSKVRRCQSRPPGVQSGASSAPYRPSCSSRTTFP